MLLPLCNPTILLAFMLVSYQWMFPLTVITMSIYCGQDRGKLILMVCRINSRQKLLQVICVVTAIKWLGEQNIPDKENQVSRLRLPLHHCCAIATPFHSFSTSSILGAGPYLQLPKSEFILVASTCLALLSLTSGIHMGWFLSRCLSIICESSLGFLICWYFLLSLQS